MTNDLNFIVDMIGSFGFPILLAIYLLSRFEKRMKALEEMIRSMHIVDQLWEETKQKEAEDEN